MRLASVLMVGGFASLLNTTIVGVSLDAVADDFGARAARMHWVASGYLLALAAVVPTMAWLVHRLGVRAVWRAGLALFVVSSVLCGTAWSVPSLVVFRVAQGLGGGLILPALQTILATAAGPDRLGRIMALVAVPGQLAPLLGPVLGGLLVDGPGWRWVFWVSVPIGVAGLVLSWNRIPDAGSSPSAPVPLDVRGLLLLSPGLALLLYGGSGLADPAGHGIVAAWVAAVVGGCLLIAYPVHAARRRNPLVNLDLFRDRGFAAASTLMALAGASIFGPMVLLPLFLQQVRGASGLETGLALAPLAVGTMVALPVAGRLTDRMGPRPLLLTGTVVAAVGTVPFAVTPEAGPGLLVVALLVRGLGLGLATVPVTAAAYRRLPPGLIPHGTTALSVVQRVGGAFGTTALLTVAQHDVANGASAAGAYGTAFALTVALSVLALLPAALVPPRRTDD